MTKHLIAINFRVTDGSACIVTRTKTFWANLLTRNSCNFGSIPCGYYVKKGPGNIPVVLETPYTIGPFS